MFEKNSWLKNTLQCSVASSFCSDIHSIGSPDWYFARVVFLISSDDNNLDVTKISPVVLICCRHTEWNRTQIAVNWPYCSSFKFSSLRLSQQVYVCIYILDVYVQVYVPFVTKNKYILSVYVSEPPAAPNEEY